MEVTKWLKPSISVSRIGDSASVQVATRDDVDQDRDRQTHLTEMHVEQSSGRSRRSHPGRRNEIATNWVKRA